MGRSKVFVGRLSDTDFVAYVSILISLIVYSFGVMVYESSGNSFKRPNFVLIYSLLIWLLIFASLINRVEENHLEFEWRYIFRSQFIQSNKLIDWYDVKIKQFYKHIHILKDNSEHEWNNYLESMISNRNIFYFLLIPVLDYISKKFFPRVKTSNNIN